MDDSMIREGAVVYDSVRSALVVARKKAATAVNDAMVEAYWEIGRQIVEAQGDRAEYGKHLMEYLSERLTEEFGKGFTKRNLHYMKQFYLAFPIVHTLCSRLSWSHYRLLMRVEDDRKREFYMQEAVDQQWTVRQLDREIHSFYYSMIAVRSLMIIPPSASFSVQRKMRRWLDTPPLPMIKGCSHRAIRSVCQRRKRYPRLSSPRARCSLNSSAVSIFDA